MEAEIELQGELPPTTYWGVCGRQAHAEGLRRDPELDPELVEHVEGYPAGSPWRDRDRGEWLRGWDEAERPAADGDATTNRHTTEGDRP